MAFHPPKGVKPPQLEGKRTGRPKGSPNFAPIWRDVKWAYEHRFDDQVSAPTAGALVWWQFASFNPDGFEEWLARHGKLQRMTNCLPQ